MSADIEFSLRICGDNDLDSGIQKPFLPIPSNVFLKRCSSITVAGCRINDDFLLPLSRSDSRSVILTSMPPKSEVAADLEFAVKRLRAIEIERGFSLFIMLSLTSTKLLDDDFLTLCRLSYMNGIDSIVIDEVESAEQIQDIRDKALGLRGRRVKIILDMVDNTTEAAKLADGVIAGPAMRPDDARDLLSLQKLVITRRLDQTDKLKADMLLVDSDLSETPATTVPSSPLLSSAIAPLRSRNFLLNEVMKFLSSSSRIIIALSDDGMCASELSVQSRISSGNGRRLPPIVGLSPSESSCRFMGCLFGVIPLQTQSFVSIDTVVMNAISFAKDRRMIQDGDEVIVVLQPPPVTASTNEMCFEGVVQRRYA